MMMSLIDYWYYTGDTQYNELITQALLFQTGDTLDYMPRNQTLTEGNDDQGFWGFAVMTAAEYNFPNPPKGSPGWLALAQAVFNTQASRWNPEQCNGGLLWQIFQWNKGFDYKNSISQGCFFALAARLAVYTGNTTYSDWATKTWDWMVGVEFINKYWQIVDGAHVGDNCTEKSPYLFTYNAGTFILGAAAMYNLTEDQVWKDRMNNLLKATSVFFTGPKKNIMTEVACETVHRCDLDEQSFKAYLSRWFAAITKWVPDTYEFVMPYLQASAVAAAKQCVGGANKRMCGLIWYNGSYDGTTGVGQQMAAMEVTLSLLIKDRPSPYTAHSGGTSKGNPGAGGSDFGRVQPKSELRSMTAGDRAGAGILTGFIIIALIAGIAFMFVDEVSEKTVLQQMYGFKGTVIGGAVSGGTAAAVSDEKEIARGENNKGVFAVTSSDRRSSRSSEENNRVIEAAPVKIGRVRAESVGQRRLSNMPLGWPHNPAISRNSGSGSLNTSQRHEASGSINSNEASDSINGNEASDSINGNEASDSINGNEASDSINSTDVSEPSGIEHMEANSIEHIDEEGTTTQSEVK